jgi:hypothetical protein
MKAADYVESCRVERDALVDRHRALSELLEARDFLAGLLREVIEKPETLDSPVMRRVLLERVAVLEAV